ncbi:MAG: hypothetical protein R3C52_06125 [Hyphomonadaceae bacterium]
MRILLVAASAAAVVAAPAFADTLTNVTTKGVIMSIQGMEIPVNYAEDGTFSGVAMDMPFSGTWAIKDGQLCTTSDFQPDERCVAYPEDKNPGDSFEIESEMGPITVKINE